jgi:hypothetical protein
MDGEHQKIARQDQQLKNVAVGPTVEQSDPIYFAKAAGGSVIAFAGELMTNLTWWGSHNGVDYVGIVDSGTAFSTPISVPSGQAIPDICFAYPWLKITVDVAGHLQVCLKG